MAIKAQLNVNAVLSPDLAAALKDEKKQNGVSATYIVNVALREYFERKHKKESKKTAA